MNDINQKSSDILIIGGGVIGLSIARELHKKRAGKIAILERGAVGKESSFAAAGMLSPNVETQKQDEFFRFCNESNALYPNLAEELVDETQIGIELDRMGTLCLAFNESELKEIDRRFQWHRSADSRVEMLSAEETRQIEPAVSPNILGSLFFENDGQVENRKLLRALQIYCEKNVIEIRENTEASSLLIDKDRIVGAETLSEKFFAEKVVLTAGAWTSLIKTDDFTLPEIKPIRGQMISFQKTERLFDRVIYSPRGYLVPRFDHRILIGATVEDVGFNKENTVDGIEFLRQIAFEITPTLENLEIADRWSGLRPFAADGLPILGEIPGVENLFIATAHYRNGILLAPLTAKILADKIADGVDSDYLKAFGLSRFQKAKSSEFRL